ncbi:MAG: hypothetical protein KGH57_00015 [Candidatus Micrarchaeota archaeon]|nr:hypothetical protein [Candidatus Micrarchaeota archaeon]
MDKASGELALVRRLFGMRIGMIYFAPRIEDKKGFSKLVYVLPDSESNPAGFVKETDSTANVIDLTLDEEKIFAQFHRNTRYEINAAGKYGIKVEYNTHYREAVSLMNGFFKRKRLRFPGRVSESELRQSPHLLAEGWLDGRLVNVNYMAIHRNLITQIFTCSDELGERRNLISIVARYSHFETMKKAKAEGIRAYSMGSISAHDHSAITSFKLSFGGRQVPLPSYVKVYNPTLRLTKLLVG